MSDQESFEEGDTSTEQIAVSGNKILCHHVHHYVKGDVVEYELTAYAGPGGRHQTVYFGTEEASIIAAQLAKWQELE